MKKRGSLSVVLFVTALALVAGCGAVNLSAGPPSGGAPDPKGNGIRVDGKGVDLSKLEVPKIKIKLNLNLTGGGQVTATLESFAKLSTATGGLALKADAPKDLPALIRQAVKDGVPKGPLDLVFVVDTTGSMGEVIDSVKSELKAILGELSQSNPDRFVGLVAYKDKGDTDTYVSKMFVPLTKDDGAMVSGINQLNASGGGDFPEHVYAGLDTALKDQPWRPGTTKHIVLIGDAPPHDDYANDPRNFDHEIGMAKEKQVKIHTIGVTCSVLCKKEISL